MQVMVTFYVIKYLISEFIIKKNYSFFQIK